MNSRIPGLQLALAGALGAPLLVGLWISPAAAQSNNPSTGRTAQNAGNNTTSGGVRFQPPFGDGQNAGNNTTTGGVRFQPPFGSGGGAGGARGGAR